jgi:hypothetical protein
MKSRSWNQFARVIMLINTLLLLAGILAFRYAYSQVETGHWSPSSPPYVDPYSSYRQPHS